VHLTKPALYYGYIEVEASSENEAVELAEKHWEKVEWDYDDPGDNGAIEVIDVELVDDPPDGALLVRQGYSLSNATLDGLFAVQPGESE
jgi:hypothetical protein